MSKALDNVLCIDKNILNKALLIIGDNSDRFLDDNGSKYLIDESQLNEISKKLERIIEFKKRTVPQDLSYMDSSLYKELNDKYVEMLYGPIRDKAINFESEKINKEEELRIGIRINDLIDGIKKLPELIEIIKNEIREIKKNNLSENINTICINFNKLYRNGGSLEEYLNVKKELDLIIKKSYIDSINNHPYDNKGIFLVKEDNDVKILSSENMNEFKCGLIYSPASIKCVRNKNDNSFISFYSMNENPYKIELNDDKPIGIYAITYGEGSISQNYKKAKYTYSQVGIPFIEIDKTKYIDQSELNIKELIDDLLNDKGIPVKNKDEDFYSKFQFFYDKFKILKTSEYDEGRIINLFDFCHNIIFSQRWLDPNYLLSSDNSVEAIKEAFDHNIYLDFNIFRNERIGIDQLDTFERIFYSKKDDRRLNMVYAGIDKILEEIHNASRERKQEIVNIINSAPCRDSYLIKQLIITKNNQKEIKDTHNNKSVNFVRTDNYDDRVNSLLSLLKSSDGRSR